MKRSLSCLLPTLGLAAALRAAPPPELPLTAFFDNAAVSSVVISPSGRYLAALMPAHSRMNLTVVDLQAGTRRRLTDMKDENITEVRWKSDDRLLFRQQYKGQERFGLFAVNRDGSNLRILQDVVRLDGENAENQAKRNIQVVDYLKGDPDHILVSSLRGRSGLGDIHRLNIHNERMTKVLSNPGKAREWLTDRAGVVRLAVSQDEEADRTEILYRADAKSDWVLLESFPNEAGAWKTLGFEGDNRTLWIATNAGRATSALCTYDPERRAIIREVAADPVYDIGDQFGLGQLNGAGRPLYSSRLGRVVGIPVNFAKPAVLWFDAEYERLQADIDGALPDTFNRIVSTSDDETKLVILASSDRNPGEYHLLDTRTFEMRRLLRTRETINPAQMAEVRPISFAARDGLTLHGYLTLPAGREPRHLPLVLHPHGGPYGPRDSWGFDPGVQFLANRGYAVLQVNFRGSGGYGEAFQALGYKQWGLLMQDDLTDGVKWAVAQGYADPSRVAIFGASYGGYATLAGLVFTPELYCCGINYVGVSDLTRLDLYTDFGAMPRAVQRFVARRWGSPLGDKAQLEATSPVNFVERIRVPLLMAYGKYDPRVRIDQGEVLEERLRKTGRPFTNIVVENEGHGFGKVENRLAFYEQVDAFLRQNLAGIPSGRVEIKEAKVLEMPAKP